MKGEIYKDRQEDQDGQGEGNGGSECKGRDTSAVRERRENKTNMNEETGVQNDRIRGRKGIE